MEEQAEYIYIGNKLRIGRRPLVIDLNASSNRLVVRVLQIAN
jgi:hypothetical protein